MAITQVLARKWRPKNFTELSGQEHVVKALFNALTQNRLHHAYLFTGTRGVGKTTIARILAKALNCEQGITPSPCGQCSACAEIDGGRFIDLIELDAASNTGIDNMREVLDNAQYRPTVGRFKVYIIDEVHMLSTKAFNSMLKTLEEPPEHVKFILATTDPQKIPVTVLSRCLQFNLKQIPETQIRAHLEKILGLESISFEAQGVARIARAAAGSMRDALSLLDQAIAYSGGSVEENIVRDMLGAVDRGYLYSLLEALLGKDGSRLLAVADEMEMRSLSFDAALQDLASLLHQIALAQIVPQAIAGDLPEREQLLALAAQFAPDEIQLLYEIAIRGRNEIALAPDEYSGFTMTLIRMLAFLPQNAQQSTAAPAPQREKQQSAAPAPAGGEKPQAANTATVAPARNPVAAPVEKAASAAPAPIEENIASASEQAAVAAPEAAPAASTPDADGGKKFSGDWVSMVNELKLNGMAKMLASHSSLQNFSDNEMILAVSDEHRHLMDKSYQDRVKAAVSDYLGRKIELKFTHGAGITPAKIETQQKDDRQKEAVAAIEADPFVRTMVENYEAKLIESSIKPI